MYDILGKYVNSTGSLSVVNQSKVGGGDGGPNFANLAWNPSLFGAGVQLSENNNMAFLK